MIKWGLLLAAFYTTGLCAQTVQPAVALSHYVLDSFTKGSVLQKSGAVTEQILNYNILTGEMIFKAGDRYLAIAEPQNVDTVFIQNRTFIPIENKFYEVLAKKPVPLLLEYTYTVQEPGASVGYGSTSTTTAAAALRSLITSGGAYPLKLPDAFQIKVGYGYWISKEGNLRKTNNVQQLINMFPGKKRVIADWVKTERTSFSNPNDVIRLVQQLDR
jgi:hypothetical protein